MEASSPLSLQVQAYEKALRKEETRRALARLSRLLQSGGKILIEAVSHLHPRDPQEVSPRSLDRCEAKGKGAQTAFFTERLEERVISIVENVRQAINGVRAICLVGGTHGFLASLPIARSALEATANLHYLLDISVSPSLRLARLVADIQEDLRLERQIAQWHERNPIPEMNRLPTDIDMRMDWLRAEGVALGLTIERRHGRLRVLTEKGDHAEVGIAATRLIDGLGQEFSAGAWRLTSGGVHARQWLVLPEIITTSNSWVVPPAIMASYMSVIDSARLVLGALADYNGLPHHDWTVHFERRAAPVLAALEATQAAKLLEVWTSPSTRR